MSFPTLVKSMSDPLTHAIRVEQELEMLANRELIVSEGKPVLVLAVTYPPRGKFTRPMVDISHQCGGIACHHMSMTVLPLTPNPMILAGMQLLEREWYDTCMGALGTSLEDVLLYRSQLKSLIHADADCNMSYRDLQEAVYTIDLDMRVIRELCEDELPDDLDDLIKFDTDMSRVLGMVGRWKCYILAENSD